MGMIERCIPLSRAQAWSDALAGVPHAFAHTAAACHAIQLTTRLPTSMYVLQTAEGRVVCPFAERSYRGYVDITTPYQFSGFTGVGACAGFQAAWRRFVERRGFVCGYFAQHPALPEHEYFSERDVRADNTLYLLDLRQSQERLLASFERNRRRQLRSYATTPFVYDRRRLARFLIETYPAFVARVRASGAQRFESATLGALAELESVEIIGAGEDRIEAVYLFGWTPYAGDCLLNVATETGRRISTALLWWGVLTLRARGVPMLNLGGGPQAGDSVARAKERFRAQAMPFRTVRQVYRPDQYQTLCRDRGVGLDPHGDARYFPAYRSLPA
jgi:hypothetical protein